MAAYLVVELEVTSPSEYEEYKRLAQDSVARYGGRYLARGGEVAALEGPPPASRVVLLEFPSMPQLRAWWGSPEYALAKKVRQRSATAARFMAVAGAD